MREREEGRGTWIEREEGRVRNGRGKKREEEKGTRTEKEMREVGKRG